MNRARYFVRRLIRPGRNAGPLYLFRILPDVSVEIYDVGAHAWRPRLLEPLYRWALIDPEIGVDEIPIGDALAIMRALDRRAPRSLVA